MSQQPNSSLLIRLGCALIAAVSAALPARADYQSTVLSQNPVAYYRLNETVQPVSSHATNSGTLGSSADGFYTNLPALNLPGPFAGSVSVGLDGVSQSVDTPWVAGLNTPSFSFEMWANPAVVPEFAYLASSAELNSPRSGWYLVQDNGSTFGYGPAWVVRLFNTNAANQSVTLHAANSASGWIHLVLTYDGTTAKLYTNGVVADTELTTANAAGLGYVPNVDAPFSVGLRSSTDVAPFYWPGQAAEAAIYSSALSAGRVAAHYTAATMAPATYAATVLADAPLLYDRYQAPVQPVASNIGSLGSAGNGLYLADAVPGVSGPTPPTYPGFPATNKAPAFDAGGGSVHLPAFNFNTNTITISGWVNASNAQTAAAGLVVCDAGAPTTYAGLTMDPVNGGFGLGFVWNNDPNTYNWSPSSDGSYGGNGPYLPMLNNAEWAFVALVVQPTEADIYIASPTIPFSSVTNILNNNGVEYNYVNQAFDGPTLIGMDAGKPGQSSYLFNGAIDQVALWNRSLSAGELYSQFGSAVGGLPPTIFVDLATPAQPIFAGDTLTLAVNAGGTPVLSYQWFSNSVSILGATNSVYSKTNFSVAADSGNYQVIVTNLYGSATSAVAVVTGESPTTPVIVVPPAGTTLYPGATLNLNVVATGGGLKYQWSKGGVPIPGATLPTLTIASVVPTNGGSYSVLVTNTVGSTNAGPAVVTVITPATNSYEAAIVADTPEAWYRLDETNGATLLHDSMGRHDGYYTNSTGGALPTLGVPGALAGSGDTAVSFDGSSSAFGYVPFSAALNSEEFAIEAWVNTTVNEEGIMAVSSHSASFEGYGLWQVPAGMWSGEVSLSGADYYVQSTTTAASVVAGQWTHLVMTYGSSSGLQVYINGQWDGNAYEDFTRNSDSPFIIGAFGPLPVQYMFNGRVDEVAVYDHALTLAQAQNHYSLGKFGSPIPPFFLLVPQSNEIVSNALATVTLNGQADGPLPITYQWYLNGVPISGATNTSLTLSDTYSNAGAYVLQASNGNGHTNSPAATLAVLPPNPAYVNVTNGLVLHLKFDGNYQDSSGRGNNGAAAGTGGALPTFTSGRLGSGAVQYVTDTSTGMPFNLDTNAVVTDSSYVTLGDPTDLQFSSNTDFSVSYWIKLPAGYLNGDLPFFCSSFGSTYGTGFTFAPGYTNGGFAFSYNGVGLQGPPNSINDGNWHHLLHSVSRTGYAYAYLDGVQVDSRLATGIGNMNTAGPINIGQDPTGLYPEPGSAAVDDLAVWRRALSVYEAYAVYYAATNANTSFDVPPSSAVHLGLSGAGTNLVLTWKPGSTLGTLQQATNLTGPWTPVGAYTPVYHVPPTATGKFYRLSFIQ